MKKQRNCGRKAVKTSQRSPTIDRPVACCCVGRAITIDVTKACFLQQAPKFPSLHKQLLSSDALQRNECSWLHGTAVSTGKDLFAISKLGCSLSLLEDRMSWYAHRCFIYTWLLHQGKFGLPAEAQLCLFSFYNMACVTELEISD